MSPPRLASFAVALLVGLHGSAPAQPPEDVPAGGAVAPAVPEADPDAPPPARWIGEVDVFAVRPQNYFAYWGQGSKGLTVYKDVPPRWQWTVAPQATLGYQFADGSAFLASYRFIGSSGQFRDDYSTTHADLATHSLDLDYRGRIFRPWETVGFQAQTGVRLGFIDQEARYQDSYESDRLTRTFLGAGPHLGSILTWNPGGGAFGLFGRADVGVLVGQWRAQARTHYAPPADSSFLDYTPPDTSDTVKRTQFLVNPRVELGMNWRSSERPWLTVEGGVRLDDFALYDHAVPGASIIHNVGPFVRCKLAF